MTTLDAFGRRCIAWPCAFAACALTEIAGQLLRFAAWMMDYEFDDEGDVTE